MNEYKLKDLIHIHNGRPYAHLSDGIIPVYGSGGIICYVNEALYDREAILLPRKGTLNNIMYSNQKIWVIDTMYYATTNNKACPYYLYRYLGLLNLSHLDSGSALPSMTQATFYDIKVKLPNIKTQQRIASVLSALDDKIEINNRINTELEAMAKTLYDYWFVQFDFPDENGNPYKSSGGKMVYSEELKREIPEGWEVKQLKGNVKFEKGISYTSKEIENNDGIPMINLSSITVDRKYRSKLKFYSGKNINKKVSFGDMLIACIDLTRNADIIGSPIYVPKEYEEYVFSMDLAKIEIITDKLKQNYLYMSLMTDYYHNFIKWYASGTNVLHLDLKGIEYYPLLFPNIDIQKKFAYKIKIIEEKKLL